MFIDQCDEEVFCVDQVVYDGVYLLVEGLLIDVGGSQLGDLEQCCLQLFGVLVFGYFLLQVVIEFGQFQCVFVYMVFEVVFVLFVFQCGEDVVVDELQQCVIFGGVVDVVFVGLYYQCIVGYVVVQYWYVQLVQVFWFYQVVGIVQQGVDFFGCIY